MEWLDWPSEAQKLLQRNDTGGAIPGGQGGSRWRLVVWLVTVVAGVYIYMKMRKLKAILMAEQTVRLEEKRRAQHPEPAFI